ncbi:MAG TPA: lysophospholipid acyltransferase family protein [Anaerolineales bacterium]|nr:lysophospholipid acyltransferase family protein [Anaerolineales bacterium]
MLNQPSSPPPKPITEMWRPDLVALAPLTFRRRIFRAFFRGLTKLLTFLLLHARVSGLENFPRHGPAVIVFNHLGDTDAVLMMATLPYKSPVEGIGKIELNDHWLVGPIFRAYGIIWVHRGRPDRKALRAALDALAEGRMVALAPEGRQSLIGGLEDGNPGAAFLALKSSAPVVPVALTGTENPNIYGHFKRWKRAPVTLKVGEPLFIRQQVESDEVGGTRGQRAMREATRQIMETLARLLPEAYRGNYKSNPDK